MEIITISNLIDLDYQIFAVLYDSTSHQHMVNTWNMIRTSFYIDENEAMFYSLTSNIENTCK